MPHKLWRLRILRDQEFLWPHLQKTFCRLVNKINGKGTRLCHGTAIEVSDLNWLYCENPVLYKFMLAFASRNCHVTSYNWDQIHFNMPCVCLLHYMSQ